jgi:carboxylesterase type B
VDKSVWSEDCFQVNVWVPVGDAPEGGWPVLFYIRTFNPHPS